MCSIILLLLGRTFAELPDDVKSKYESPDSRYSFGWSFGKETLRPGVYDTFKGSYYNNPLFDVPTTDQDKITNFPEVCRPNIWPKDDIPEFETAFKELGELVCRVGLLVTKFCDRYVKNQLGDDYNEGTLQATLEQSRSSKARLLYYFPIKTPGERDIDSWCGWHNDHSLITGLCSALYQNIDQLDYAEVPNPDPKAGLYVRNRKNETQKVLIPRDSLAFQIGLVAQVLSGGKLRATPHAVKGLVFPESASISRTTFAVFMQPNVDFNIDLPSNKTLDEAACEFYKTGMNFGEFGAAVIKAYY